MPKLLLMKTVSTDSSMVMSLMIQSTLEAGNCSTETALLGLDMVCGADDEVDDDVVVEVEVEVVEDGDKGEEGEDRTTNGGNFAIARVWLKG